jgi:hypothetical protein
VNALLNILPKAEELFIIRKQIRSPTKRQMNLKKDFAFGQRIVMPNS